MNPCDLMGKVVENRDSPQDLHKTDTEKLAHKCESKLNRVQIFFGYRAKKPIIARV
jgi:hypothetical protein